MIELNEFRCINCGTLLGMEKNVFKLFFIYLLLIIPVSASYLQVQNGTTIRASNVTQQMLSNSESYVLVSTIITTENISGVMNLSFRLWGSNGGCDGTHWSYAKLKKNGVDIGEEQSSVYYNIWYFKSQNLSLVLNTTDTLELWGKMCGGDVDYVDNFTLAYDYVSAPTITSPTNNSVQTSRIINITWTGTSLFQYQVSQQSNFLILLFNATIANNFSGDLTLPTGVNYIRVRGYNTTVDSATNWSSNVIGIYSNITQFGRYGSPWAGNVTYLNTEYLNSSDDIKLKKYVNDWYNYYSFDTLLGNNETFPAYVYDENLSIPTILSRNGYPRTIGTITGQGVVFNNVSITGNSTSDYFISNNSYNYSSFTFQTTFKAFNYTDSLSMMLVRAGYWRVYITTDPANQYYKKLIFLVTRSTTNGEWVANTTQINLNTRYNISISYDNSNVNNDPVIYINGNSESIIETGIPDGNVNNDRSDAYWGRAPNGLRSCDCQLDETYVFGRNITYQERLDIANNVHLLTGNFTTISNNFYIYNKIPLFIKLNSTIFNGSSVDLYQNYSIGNSWSGDILVSSVLTSENIYSLEKTAENISLKVVLYNTTGFIQSPSIIDIKLYDVNIPTQITGLKNDTPSDISINISWDVTSNVSYYDIFRDGVFVSTTMDAFYNDTLLFQNTNYIYTVREVPLGQNSSITVRTSGLNNYLGTPPTNLNRLQKSNLYLTQYLYPDNTYFFKYNYSGTDDWNINSTDRSANCSGLCSGLYYHPIEFWLRPNIDGNITIHVQKFASTGDVDIYINGGYNQLVNLTGSGEFDINLTGLNQSIINHVVINTTNTSVFRLYYIKYNRDYPAIYNGLNYIQIKKVSYTAQWNHTGIIWPTQYYVWKNIFIDEIISDFIEIKALNFTMVSMPLEWGSFVDEIRIQSDGMSRNKYNQTTFNLLDQVVDNASNQNLYVFLWFAQFPIPSEIKKMNDNYPCARCLINNSERDSMIELVKTVSNRYKNHTNLMFDLPFENLDGDTSDSAWYADPENIASWQAHSGKSYITLPHNSTFTNEDVLSVWNWQTDKFYELSNLLIPTIHTNNQLITFNFYSKLITSWNNYTEYTNRLSPNISNYDFIGVSNYPINYSSGNGNLTMDEILDISYEKASVLKAFGTAGYTAEFGINTDSQNYSYWENGTEIIKNVLNKTLTNSVPFVDYDNKDIYYGLAGYSYWRWQEGSACTRIGGIILDECWGIKFQNGTYLPWAQTIGVLNVGDNFAPASITSASIIIENNKYNNTWIFPTDFDFSYIQFKYSNGTELIKIFNGTNKYISDITTEQNISAQTVDIWGNINLTLVWFNSTDLIFPSGITNAFTITTTSTSINWSWINPTDVDFDHVEIWINGTFNSNTSLNYFLLAELPILSERTISTRTVDAIGNINSTWVNQTSIANEVFDQLVFNQLIFNIGYQAIFINTTQNMTSIRTMMNSSNVEWIIKFNSTSQKWEAYKAGWNIRATNTVNGGEAVYIKFTNNDTVSRMKGSGSYSWVTKIGWNLLGLDYNGTRTLSQVNTSLNYGGECIASQISYTNLSTQVESLFTCGSAGNASVLVDKGEGFFVNSISELSLGRTW